MNADALKAKIKRLEVIIKGHHSSIREYRRDLENAELKAEIAKLKSGRQISRKRFKKKGLKCSFFTPDVKPRVA